MKDGTENIYYIDAMNPTSPEKIRDLLNKYLSSTDLNKRNKRQLEGDFIGTESKKAKVLEEGELIDDNIKGNTTELEGEYIGEKTTNATKLQEGILIDAGQSKSNEETQRLTNEKIEKEKQEAERIKVEENAKLEAQRLANEKLEKEKQEAERVKAEENAKLEAQRLANEKLEKEKQEAERIKVEENAKLEAQRLANEKLEKEKQEAERIKAEENAKLEAERLANEKLEKEKQEAERIKAEENAKLEAERLANEKIENEKKEAERIKAEENAQRLANEKLEKEKQESERIKVEEKAKVEAERLANIAANEKIAAALLTKQKKIEEQKAQEQGLKTSKNLTNEKTPNEVTSDPNLLEGEMIDSNKDVTNFTSPQIPLSLNQTNNQTNNDKVLLEGELLDEKNVSTTMPQTPKIVDQNNTNIVTGFTNNKTATIETNAQKIQVAASQTTEKLLEPEVINDNKTNDAIPITITELNVKDNNENDEMDTYDNNIEAEFLDTNINKTIKNPFIDATNRFYTDDNIYDNFFGSSVKGTKEEEFKSIFKPNIGEGELIEEKTELIDSKIKENMLIDSWVISNWKNLTEEEKMGFNTAPKDLINIIWDKFDYRFKLEISDPNVESVTLSSKLNYVLGFKNSEIIQKTTTAKFQPDLYGSISQFALYSPQLTEGMILGDTISSLLRIVTVDCEPGKMKDQIYYNPIYNKVAARDISDIQIEIRTLTGELIDFMYGPVIVTLNFKKAIDF
uniref:Uncharacterized protein n=1 Tax=Panagrolaimus davidi TaxID=227884 RepID=A0A914QB81_9BILA